MLFFTKDPTSSTFPSLDGKSKNFPWILSKPGLSLDGVENQDMENQLLEKTPRHDFSDPQ